MRDFNRDSSYNREERQMHRATCADCGKSCEVPFKPTNNKPVFCSNCFKRDDSPRSDRGGRDDRGGSRGRDDRGGSRGRDDRGGRNDYGSDSVEMHEAVCDDCGKDCEVPFKPSRNKPVFCDRCFGKGDSPRRDSIEPKKPDHSKKMHDEMNEKIDTILILLQRLTSGKEESPKKKVAAKKEEETEVKKEVKKAAPKKAAVKKVAAKKPAAKKAPAKKKAAAKK